MFMIALAWVVLVAVYPLIGLGNAKRRRRLQQILDSVSEEQLSYAVEIDEEKIVIVSNGQTRELPWTEFIAFGVHQETLYVFNAVKGTNSLYWNQSEMGREAYSSLLEILKKKAVKQAF